MDYGIAKNIPGMLVGYSHEVDSLAATEVTTPGSAAFVAEGVERKCYPTAAAGRHFRGVIKGDHMQAPIAIGDELAVVTRGVVIVAVAEDVDAHTTAYLTAGGAFGAAGTAIGGRYLTNAVAGENAELELFGN
jgi:hypothetical protein